MPKECVVKSVVAEEQWVAGKPKTVRESWSC